MAAGRHAIAKGNEVFSFSASASFNFSFITNLNSPWRHTALEPTSAQFVRDDINLPGGLYEVTFELFTDLQLDSRRTSCADFVRPLQQRLAAPTSTEKKRGRPKGSRNKQSKKESKKQSSEQYEEIERHRGRW